ncbi:MAG: ABC-F family ATP-binding cassette domain-containing protein [Solirubrobacterales bacterium]
MAAPRNLVNLKTVSKSYSSRPILTDITLGVNADERIGIVGTNGDGKTTLLRLISGVEHPDGGEVTRSRATTVGFLDQRDLLPAEHTVREVLIGEMADHEWAGEARIRDILDGLLGGVDVGRFPDGFDTKLGPLSGGEKRRIALAKVLIDGPELLLLDEPTNHLDVEGVDWLASHLNARSGSLLVVTHDRWFLDAVVEQTWEVADQRVHQYEGGYAAYVLAKAERDRQNEASETRRRALIRKELAWLRRGPPARTTKPKFRVDAANELIADEPPPRNPVELLKFATARLGNRVIDAINVSFAFGDRKLFDHITWRLGPGDRSAIVGVNGAGKSTLIQLLNGDIEPQTGSVKRGQTIRVAKLTQEADDVNEELSVIEALEDAKLVATLSDGVEITAGMLCDRFGFRGGRSRTLVKKLSGGERRRLQLMRLMMGEPNVLLLDEPTNDLDIDTLTALEDLLDNWPGTLIVVSHDRYFVERVTDNVYGLMGDGKLRHLPRGIDQYIEERHGAHDLESEWAPKSAKPKRSSGGVVHAARKELVKIERSLKKLDERERELASEMEEHASDHEQLAGLQAELADLTSRREQLELSWLENTELVEG